MPHLHANETRSSTRRAEVLIGFTRVATLWSLGVAILFVSCTTYAQSPPHVAATLTRYEFAEPHMGVTFRIVLYATDEITANKASQAAFARVEMLNGLLSDYDPQSELSRLSDTAGQKQPVPVSEELWFVLAAANDVSQLSEGAFDVTVGSAVKLWRRARRVQELPDEKLLAAARDTIGYQNVILMPKGRTVTITKANVRLDLGGIAKGYAADEALRVLKSLGVNRALVAASGDVVLGDAPPNAKGWRVAIAPLEVGQAAERYLLLANAAVSTSGDAFQFVEIDGRRYSHILDPRTGVGLTERVSVTVVAPTGIQSDSLASAVCVLGIEAGLKMIEALPNAAALIVQAGETRPTEHASQRMQKLLLSEQLLPSE